MGKSLIEKWIKKYMYKHAVENSYIAQAREGWDFENTLILTKTF